MRCQFAPILGTKTLQCNLTAKWMGTLPANDTPIEVCDGHRHFLDPEKEIKPCTS